MLPKVELSCRLPGMHGFSNRDIDTRPTVRMRLFTGTCACLLIQVLQKTVALTELAGGPVGIPRTKQTSRTVFSALQVLDFFNAKVNAVQTTVGQSPAV